MIINKTPSEKLEHEEAVIATLSNIKHRIYPRPFGRLAISVDKKNLIGCEIGVFWGDHAISLLDTLDIQKLYLIDSYKMYEGYDEADKQFGKNNSPFDAAKISAKKKLDRYKDKIVWIEKYSNDAVSDIVEELDFAYIDANHKKEYIQNDIVNYARKIKAGGVIGGHDFYNGFEKSHDDVVDSVIKYAVENDLKLTVELPDWWIHL